MIKKVNDSELLRCADVNEKDKKKPWLNVMCKREIGSFFFLVDDVNPKIFLVFEL